MSDDDKQDWEKRYPITGHPYVVPENRFDAAVLRSIQNEVRVADAERRLDALNGQLARNADLLAKIQVSIARIMVIGPVFLILANGLVALAVYELTKGVP